MDVKMIWTSGLSFTGSAESGFTVPLDAETSVGGAGNGFRPMELILTGLAGCTAMDVISVLQKKRQMVTAFEVQAHATRAAGHPRVFLQAVVEYHVTGQGVEEAALLRAIELSATRYCPAQAMLGQIFPIELKYFIYEEQNGGRTPVTSGEWAQAETSGVC